MRRIDDHTVELTDEEMVASETFEGLLDTGKDPLTAGILIEEHMPHLSREFIDYLVF